jgi:hypothetical protein
MGFLTFGFVDAGTFDMDLFGFSKVSTNRALRNRTAFFADLEERSFSMVAIG